MSDETKRLAAGALRATAYVIKRYPDRGTVDHVLEALVCAVTGGAQDDTSLGSTLPADEHRWMPVYVAALEAVEQAYGVKTSDLPWDDRGIRALRRAADLLDG